MISPQSKMAGMFTRDLASGKNPVSLYAMVTVMVTVMVRSMGTGSRL